MSTGRARLILAFIWERATDAALMSTFLSSRCYYNSALFFLRATGFATFHNGSTLTIESAVPLTYTTLRRLALRSQSGITEIMKVFAREMMQSGAQECMSRANMTAAAAKQKGISRGWVRRVFRASIGKRAKAKMARKRRTKTWPLEGKREARTKDAETAALRLKAEKRGPPSSACDAEVRELSHAGF